MGTNVNVSCKRVTLPGFSELLLCVQFLKNIQLKMITMARRAIRVAKFVPLYLVFREQNYNEFLPLQVWFWDRY